jgi:tripartite-type tricarboxylate transporter receptor subunit TctC
VENKLGAGGTIAANYVAKAAPDGYTFLIHHNGMGTAPALYRKLPYNPLTDFEYVSQVMDVPMTLIARKDMPAKDFKELAAYMKANGDKVNIAHAGLGAVSHLCSVLLRQAIGADATTIPYSGTAPAMNALLGGQVDLLCDQTTSTTPHIKAGSVKLYGVTTSSRIKTMPDTPTLAEQGLPGFQMVVWHGVYAPKGTPKIAIEKFGQALRAALKDPAVSGKLTDAGAMIVSDDKLTPAGLQTWLQQETLRYGPVIKSAGQFAD